MKKFSVPLALAFALALVGCQNDCEAARDHWEECVKRDSRPPGMTGDECSERNECIANCVNDATCLELQRFSDPTGAWVRCTSKC